MARTARWHLVAAVVVLSAAVLGAGPSGSHLVDRASAADGAVGWSNVTPSLSPPAMAGAMLAYSSAAHRFVLFGGWNGTTGLNGTWVYDAGNRSWEELHPAVSPSSRGDAMFVYDVRADVFILFGGWHEWPNGSYARLDDTWQFSLASDAWAERHPAAAPSARSDSAVAYDPAADAILLVGGFSGTTYLGDVWCYYLSNDTWSARPAAVSPSPRADGRMVYASVADRFVLFGGNDYSGPNFTFHHLADTWSYDWSANVWALAALANGPSARDYPVFAFDPADGLALLTGGFGNNTILNDLWSYDVTTNAWANITPATSPPVRFAAVGGFDPADDLFVLFSGASTSGLLADTWHYVYTPPAGGPGSTAIVGAVVGAFLGVGAVVTLVILRRRRPPRARESPPTEPENRGPP